jgi:hypothetical protein
VGFAWVDLLRTTERFAEYEDDGGKLKLDADNNNPVSRGLDVGSREQHKTLLPRVKIVFEVIKVRTDRIACFCMDLITQENLKAGSRCFGRWQKLPKMDNDG